jgi:hypothetical protein
MLPYRGEVQGHTEQQPGHDRDTDTDQANLEGGTGVNRSKVS